jgi:hypothetical protein
MTKPKVYRSIAEMPHHYVSIEELEKNLDADAAWADAHYGPDVPPLTRPRGRPKKGSPAAHSTARTVRMADDAWVTAEALAAEIGVTRNAVLQIAVLKLASAKR